MVANRTVDALGALAELELRRVHSDHYQAALGVVAIPGFDERQRTNPIDARVLQKSTLPRSPAAVSGAEFTQRSALNAGRLSAASIAPAKRRR